MAEFRISPSVQGFLSDLQKGTLPGVWSKGVALARSGMVQLEKCGEDEILARVRNPDRPVSAKVQLWPHDEDHFCDCSEKANPCFHVAACIAALKSGAVQLPTPAPELAGTARTTGSLRYRFRRVAGERRLVFERLLDGRPFPESLVSTIGGIESSRLSGVKIAATQEDFGVDRVLAVFLPSARTTAALEQLSSRREFLEKLLAVLRDIGQVEIDEGSVSIGSPTTAFQVEVRDAGDGFRLVASQEELELFTNGLVLQRGQLRLLRDPGLSDEERRMLAGQGRVFRGHEVRTLVTEVLPSLERKVPVTIQTSRLPRVDETPPRAKIELEKLGDFELGVSASIEYSNSFSLRDPKIEQELLRRVQFELHLVPGHRARFAGVQAIEFASRIRDYASRDPESTALSGSGLQHFAVHGELSLEIPPIGELLPGASPRLDLRFTTAAGQAADPERVLSAWRDGASLVPLLDGGFAKVPREALARHGRILQRLLDLQERHAGKLPRYAVHELSALQHEVADPSAKLQEMADQFRGIPEAPLPQDLRADLRAYQRQGVNWLVYLRDSGMGALLADDMGLGKTLQALCAIRGRTLIIAPASVLQGWADQAQKFRPGLRVNLYWGPQRRLDPSADLTVTSYGLLRQDETILATEWDCAILDEAQMIKNPESQVARAAHRIRASFRIALSGTPVENRLEDLWSQFEFLNSGLLGSRRDFQEEWSGPILRGDSTAAVRLRRRIHPFILRRLKRDVAPELPPKTEVLLHCDLSDDERELYSALLSATRREVQESLDQGGSVFSALELLLRLRQASCHAALLPGQKAETSAKLEVLLENLETTLAEGHRALVFSQWTSMLDLIEPKLREAGIRFSRLDGSTADRAAVVSEFQSPDGPEVMLLSLKAGGVGLTLTAADHVFLMDSWWNPAVEDQAADRVHRIGQENPVLVCRMVARGTVEEKILELQKRKQALAQSVVGTGSAAASGITREDLQWLLK